MSLRSSEKNWGALAKSAHWLTAILILCTLAIILYGLGLDRSQDRAYWVPLYQASVYRHEAFGILALVTIGLRLIWRIVDRRPAFPATMKRWEALASSWVHGALYALAVAACILGWIQVSSNGGVVHVFGWTGLPTLTAKDAHVHDVIAFWHEWISWTFVALAVFHIAAALKHHFVDRDRVLRDMLPARD